MANQFSFPMMGPSVGSGFGSRLGDLGPQLYNALQAGMQTRNDMMDLENRERLNPQQQAAQGAQFDQARNQANLGAYMDNSTLNSNIQADQEQVGGPGAGDGSGMTLEDYGLSIDDLLQLPQSEDDSGDNSVSWMPRREDYGSQFW